MLQRWRPSLHGSLITASLVALLLWLISKTEWVEEELPRPTIGKLAADDRHVLKKVLQQIGVKVVSHDDLSQLPPPGATLLLSGWMWDVLPERSRAVHAWVEQGGNLVIEANQLSARRDDAASWIPIERVARKQTVPAAPAPDPPAQGPAKRVLPELCRKLAEPEGVAPVYRGEGAASGFTLCGFGGAPLSTRKAPLPWALASDEGNDVLRVSLGAGSVTAIRSFGWVGSGNSLFSNSLILRGDNALVAVAALQAGPGAEVWVVSGGGGQPLLAWLWSRAAAAVVLTLLAFALWLWRALARFGPIEASPPLARRSMSEQISGTASFLWRRSPEALHAAQVRALDEAAALRVRQYARLDRVDRAAAIAAATGIEAAALGRALNPGAVQATHTVPRVLAALETARRRLLDPSISSQRASAAITPEGSQ
ncbi:MAG TPA: DUF4350 domain-containing protein [Burkholderiaceae bacterium]|jgi:hypothetical protein|nr:DUF4350 domain-containing protein [Burkholderiaceae bacterium]